MSAGRTEAVWLWFHFSLLLLRAGTIDETSGGLHRDESAGPSYAEVGPNYGSYWSGRAKVNFGDPFFRWLQDQILMVDDYAYAGIDFSGDPNLPLPLGR